MKHIGLLHSSLRDGSIGVKVTLHHRPEQEDLNELNALGHPTALEIVEFLRQQFEACSECTIKSIAPEIGVRTEQRPVGKHILTQTRVLGAQKPTDGVAVGAWPIEHWRRTRGGYAIAARGEHYLIPAGALESAAIEGLYFAGREYQHIGNGDRQRTCYRRASAAGYAVGMLRRIMRSESRG
ncbi:MAG: FAD-dependent oxidoreductase [Flavobacteriales bacterium]|nr:FAD-dependent oxidoreductase [Flavobacteriales bacterium]